MADSLKRLAGPTNLASGFNLVYSGSSAQTATLKTIGIVNSTTADMTVSLHVSASSAATAANEVILPTTTIEAGGFAMSTAPHMIQGVEYLNAIASASGMTITVHGLLST